MPKKIPIDNFRPFTPERTLEVRALRETSWLEPVKIPKTKTTTRSTKTKLNLPPGLSPGMEDQIRAALKKLGM